MTVIRFTSWPCLTSVITLFLPFIELGLFQKACEEILTSSKLDKVLGIVNLLGNRLVGKAPGKKRASNISMPSLIEMLEEVKLFPTSAETNHSQPFLSYALDRIQRNNPSLLLLREDMPSLHRVASELNWGEFLTELEQLEAKLESFRRFALALSSGNGVDESTISVEDELDILQASKIGPVVVDFYLKMDGLYQTVDATERHSDKLCSRFSNGDNPKDTIDVGTVLETLARFCDSAERQ